MMTGTKCDLLSFQKSETTVTASILKQDPNTEGSQKRYLLGQNTTCESSG